MALIDKLNKTSLDLENPNPLGGPNRTNSSNEPNVRADGFYTPKSSHNITDANGEVALKDKSGKNVNFQLHRYTPANSYLNSKDWENKFPDPPTTNKKPNINLSINPFPNAGSFGGGV